jgi:hypothetical protein
MNASVSHTRRPIDDRSSDPSGTFITDRDFTSFDNDRDFFFATGVLEHFLQFGSIRLDVEVGCFVAIG